MKLQNNKGLSVIALVLVIVIILLAIVLILKITDTNSNTSDISDNANKLVVTKKENSWKYTHTLEIVFENGKPYKFKDVYDYDDKSEASNYYKILKESLSRLNGVKVIQDGKKVIAEGNINGNPTYEVYEQLSKEQLIESFQIQGYEIK